MEAISNRGTASGESQNVYKNRLCSTCKVQLCCSSSLLAGRREPKEVEFTYQEPSAAEENDE